MLCLFHRWLGLTFSCISSAYRCFKNSFLCYKNNQKVQTTEKSGKFSIKCHFPGPWIMNTCFSHFSYQKLDLSMPLSWTSLWMPFHTDHFLRPLDSSCQPTLLDIYIVCSHSLTQAMLQWNSWKPFIFTWLQPLSKFLEVLFTESEAFATLPSGMAYFSTTLGSV